jgi:hypothetical protein
MLVVDCAGESGYLLKAMTGQQSQFEGKGIKLLSRATKNGMP